MDDDDDLPSYADDVSESESGDVYGGTVDSELSSCSPPFLLRLIYARYDRCPDQIEDQ